MLLGIKAKRIAVGLFQCSSVEDGTMFLLSFFVLNTIVCSALFELLLCKNLYSKAFLNSEICVRFSSNQFVVALYYFQFFVAEFVFAL